MSNYEILSTDVASNSQVREIIAQKAKKYELTYREDKTLEYLNKFAKLSIEDFNTALGELSELNIPRVDNIQLMKILDIMPEDGTQLRAIVSHSGTILVDDNVSKILDVLKRYRK